MFISFLFAVSDYSASVTAVYTKHSPLCWGSELIGYYLAAWTASGGLGIVFAFKVLAEIFSEPMLVIISCLCYITSNLLAGFANTTAVMFVSVIPAFLGVVASPCIHSMASKMAQQHEQGTLCSVFAITEALSQLPAPLMVNLLYPIGLTKLHIKGFVYFFQAGVLLIPIMLFSIIHYLITKNQHILYGPLKDLECLPIES